MTRRYKNLKDDGKVIQLPLKQRHSPMSKKQFSVLWDLEEEFGNCDAQTVINLVKRAIEVFGWPERRAPYVQFQWHPFATEVGAHADEQVLNFSWPDPKVGSFRRLVVAHELAHFIELNGPHLNPARVKREPHCLYWLEHYDRIAKVLWPEATNMHSVIETLLTSVRANPAEVDTID